MSVDNRRQLTTGECQFVSNEDEFVFMRKQLANASRRRVFRMKWHGIGVGGAGGQTPQSKPSPAKRIQYETEAEAHLLPLRFRQHLACSCGQFDHAPRMPI